MVAAIAMVATPILLIVPLSVVSLHSLLLLWTHWVGAVRLEPVQLVLLILDHDRCVPSLLSKLGKGFDNADQAVGIESRIVLLRESEGPLFPIGHLFALAHIFSEQVLADLRQARLVGSDRDLAVVSLTVDKAREALVELHRWEVPCKDVQVALE